MKKLTTLLFLIVLIPFLAFAESVDKNAGQNSAQSISIADLQKIVQDLLKQVQSLTQQIAALQGELGAPAQATSTAPVPEIQTITPEPAPPELTRSLSRGSSGDDVRKLQEFLAKDKNIYPDGLVTGYFGPLTETAVKKWQEKHNIESVGVIGPKTISRFQELGRGVVRGLIEQGAGQSGVISPGLLTAPGIQDKATITPQTITTTISTATTTTLQATTTPSGTTPAIPAIPAQPSDTGGGWGAPAIPATPAIPAVPAVVATTTSTSTISDATPPSVPTGLVASNTSPDILVYIRVSWTASTDNIGVMGYRVYRNGTQIGSVTGTVYDNPAGLVAGATYSYTVAAYDAAGNVSAQSASASATTNSPPPPITTPLDAPTITSITPYVPIPLNDRFISSVTLQWNAMPNPSGYLTYYKAWRKLGNGDWLYWVNTQQTSFPDLNLGRGTYYYHINACYTATGSPLVLATDICSPDSNIMTATLAGGGGTSDVTPPSTPTLLRVWNPDSYGYGRNFISWTTSTDNVGVAGYNIYRNGTYRESVCCTSGEDDFVSFSPTYAYTVAAYDAAGNESAQSNSITTPLSLGAPSPLNNRASSLANVLESLRSLTATLQELQGLFR